MIEHFHLHRKFYWKHFSRFLLFQVWSGASSISFNRKLDEQFQPRPTESKIYILRECSDGSCAHWNLRSIALVHLATPCQRLETWALKGAKFLLFPGLIPWENSAYFVPMTNFSSWPLKGLIIILSYPILSGAVS